MRKLVSIKKDYNIVYNSNISEFLDPDFIYVPIKTNYKILVKKDEVVYKNQIILENNLNKVVCPVSGKVFGVIEKMIDGQKTKSLVIQNNFKEQERRLHRQNQVKNEPDAIISRLYDFYFKYVASVLETKKIKNIVVNSIEDEPYIINNSYVLKKFNKEILDLVDLLINVFNIKHGYIAIKSNDTTCIDAYLAKIGMYPKISLSLLEDKYLLGKQFFLLERMHLRQEDTLVLDVKTVLQMYYALKYSKFMHETYITIAGPSLLRSTVIRVKNGTLLKDIIDKKIKIKNNESLFVLDGLMTGYECNISDVVVTNNTKGLIVIPKVNAKEKSCNNCGMCLKVCPVKVNPKKVMDQRKVSSNCLDCGLCTYICPCNINLRKFLRGEYE